MASYYDRLGSPLMRGTMGQDLWNDPMLQQAIPVTNPPAESAADDAARLRQLLLQSQQAAATFPRSAPMGPPATLQGSPEITGVPAGLAGRAMEPLTIQNGPNISRTYFAPTNRPLSDDERQNLMTMGM